MRKLMDVGYFPHDYVKLKVGRIAMWNELMEVLGL